MKHLFKPTTMKHFLLFFLFSGSLDSFSQVSNCKIKIYDDPSSGIYVKDSLYHIADSHGSEIVYSFQELKLLKESLNEPLIWSLNPYINPDTLRAIVLVTLSPNGIAHARMGFVVIQEGRRPVYLTCDKKPLKLPQVGWGYELVETKEGRR